MDLLLDASFKLTEPEPYICEVLDDDDNRSLYVLVDSRVQVMLRLPKLPVT